ncbi:hypothetical protein ACHAWO_000305 [Cyclotella atomus]|uniref:Uncharacterized protein n=1 Tax=Cyclotella atomus TaxID=382360 RepID=A0ABD3P732_9STRA
MGDSCDRERGEDALSWPIPNRMDRGTLFGVNIDAVSVGFDTSSVTQNTIDAKEKAVRCTTQFANHR